MNIFSEAYCCTGKVIEKESTNILSDGNLIFECSIHLFVHNNSTVWMVSNVMYEPLSLSTVVLNSRD